MTAGGSGVSFGGDEIFLKLDCDDGCCATLNLLEPIKSCTLNGGMYGM